MAARGNYMYSNENPAVEHVFSEVKVGNILL